MPTTMLMIGGCTLEGSYLPAPCRNEAVLRARLQERAGAADLHIINAGRNGESLAGFLARYGEVLHQHPRLDYVSIRYAVNDRKAYGPEGFRVRLTELCDRLRSDRPGVRVLLETGMYVDYPAHYEIDRNRILEPMTR